MKSSREENDINSTDYSRHHIRTLNHHYPISTTSNDANIQKSLVRAETAISRPLTIQLTDDTNTHPVLNQQGRLPSRSQYFLIHMVEFNTPLQFSPHKISRAFGDTRAEIAVSVSFRRCSRTICLERIVFLGGGGCYPFSGEISRGY